MILYVQKNEETSYLKIIHFFEEEKGVPSELEANAKSEWDHIAYLLVIICGFFSLTSVSRFNSSGRSVPGGHCRSRELPCQQALYSRFDFGCIVDPRTRNL